MRKVPPPKAIVPPPAADAAAIALRMAAVFLVLPSATAPNAADVDRTVGRAPWTAAARRRRRRRGRDAHGGQNRRAEREAAQRQFTRGAGQDERADPLGIVGHARSVPA